MKNININNFSSVAVYVVLAMAPVLSMLSGVLGFFDLLWLDGFVALATIPIVKLDSNNAMGFDDVNLDASSFCAANRKKDIFYQWFVGFSDGEGCFKIKPKYRTDKSKVHSFYFEFEIHLHLDEQNLLNCIANTLGVGKVYPLHLWWRKKQFL